MAAFSFICDWQDKIQDHRAGFQGLPPKNWGIAREEKHFSFRVIFFEWKHNQKTGENKHGLCNRIMDGCQFDLDPNYVHRWNFHNNEGLTKWKSWIGFWFSQCLSVSWSCFTQQETRWKHQRFSVILSHGGSRKKAGLHLRKKNQMTQTPISRLDFNRLRIFFACKPARRKARGKPPVRSRPQNIQMGTLD